MATFTNTAKYALRWLTGSNLISDIDAGFQALAEDIDASMAGYASGTAASRPAAGVAGKLYRATDTGQVFIDTGTTWYDPTAAADSIWKPLWTPALVRQLTNAFAERSLLVYTTLSTGVDAHNWPLYFDPSDYAIAGKTMKIRHRTWGRFSNNIASTFTWRLRPVTGWSGGNEWPTAWGTALASTVTTLSGGGGDFAHLATSSEFDAPAAGYYDVTGELSVGISNMLLATQLQYRHV